VICSIGGAPAQYRSFARRTSFPVVLEESFEHLRYARRDLATLTSL